MKKKLFSVAILALSFTAIPTMAQDCKQAGCTGNEAKCCTDGKTKTGKSCVNPFEGLNLTDAQKEKLKAIERPCKQNAEQCKKDRQERMKASRESRTKFLADIKAVLTPEQYVQFLENNFVNNRQGNKASNQKGKKADNPAKKSPKRK